MIAGHLGEILTLIGTIDPATQANSIAYSDVIDMSKYEQVIATALLGNMASETIDFAAYKCDSDGSNPTSLKAATQLAANASTNDNSQIVIVVRPQDLADISEASRYVKFGYVTGGATGGPAACLVQGVAKQGAVGANALATLKQTKY